LSKFYKIEDESKKDLIISILAEKYHRQILENISNKSKTAIEISNETRIPISTVYRKIEMLQKVKLIAMSGVIGNDGKKIFFYKSRVEEIKTWFENGYFDVNINFKKTN